jgi:hypothetical protein
MTTALNAKPGSRKRLKYEEEADTGRIRVKIRDRSRAAAWAQFARMDIFPQWATLKRPRRTAAARHPGPAGWWRLDC